MQGKGARFVYPPLLASQTLSLCGRPGVWTPTRSPRPRHLGLGSFAPLPSGAAEPSSGSSPPRLVGRRRSRRKREEEVPRQQNTVELWLPQRQQQRCCNNTTTLLLIEEPRRSSMASASKGLLHRFQQAGSGRVDESEELPAVFHVLICARSLHRLTKVGGGDDVDEGGGRHHE